MKLSSAAFQTFLKKPTASVFAALFFGPERSLVQKRSKNLAMAWGGDRDDPFSFTILSEQDLVKDPARLSDEMDVLAFTPAQRLVRLTQAGEACGTSLKAYFKGVDAGERKAEAKLVLEAGDLPPRSVLRKLFEQHKRALAVGCYEEGAHNLVKQAQKLLEQEDLYLDPDAHAVFMAHLKGDYAHAMGEVEKLILFKGPKSLRQSDQRLSITREDVKAATLASTESRLDDFVFLTLGGFVEKSDQEMQKLLNAKTAAFTLLRALQNHMTRLWDMACMMDDGLSADRAMKRLRPPVFIFRQKDVLQQNHLWRKPLLEKALNHSLDLERQMKRVHHLDALLVSRFALQLARRAQARMQNSYA